MMFISNNKVWSDRKIQSPLFQFRSQKKLNKNVILCSESCPTIFEIGHCWRETPHDEILYTDCPAMDPFEIEDRNESTSRECFEEKTIENGSVIPAGWVGIYSLYQGKLIDSEQFFYLIGRQLKLKKTLRTQYRCIEYHTCTLLSMQPP